MKPSALVWDVGNVLVEWNPLNLYSQLISNPEKAAWWVKNSFSPEWNAKVDAGMSYAEANHLWVADFEHRHADRIADYPCYKLLIEAYGLNPVESHANVLADSIALRDGLREQFKIFALTNFSEPNWHKVNAAHGGSIDRFDELVMSGREGVVKPSEEIFSRLFNRAAAYHIAPQDMVFIDDSQRNVEVSEKLGMPAIVFTNTKKLRVELEERFGIVSKRIPVAPQKFLPASGIGKLKPLL